VHTLDQARAEADGRYAKAVVDSRFEDAGTARDPWRGAGGAGDLVDDGSDEVAVSRDGGLRGYWP
jgi:hypothetical protein